MRFSVGRALPKAAGTFLLDPLAPQLNLFNVTK
jgi:hypothetical protein